MVTTATSSIQLGDGYRAVPTENHGKLRFKYFETVAAVAQGDIGSTIDLCNLPSGRVRVLPWLSRLSNTAFGAGAQLNIGTLAYENRDADQAPAQAADPLAFTPLVPLDVAAAGDSQAVSPVLKIDLYSKAGIRVQATVAGAVVPVGASIKGFIAYIYE